MRALLFSLLLAAGSASAQLRPDPICYPFGLKGEATTAAPFVQRTDAGWHIWYYCRDPYVGLVGYGMTCAHGDCVAFDVAMRLAVEAVNGGLRGVEQTLDRVIQFRCTDQQLPQNRVIVCTELRRLIVERAPKELPPVWLVASNGTLATRPAYSFVGGVRSTASNGRATVGELCDCRTRSVEGSRVYCSVNQRTDQVALCKRK